MTHWLFKIVFGICKSYKSEHIFTYCIINGQGHFLFGTGCLGVAWYLFLEMHIWRTPFCRFSRLLQENYIDKWSTNSECRTWLLYCGIRDSPFPTCCRTPSKHSSAYYFGPCWEQWLSVAARIKKAQIFSVSMGPSSTRRAASGLLTLFIVDQAASHQACSSVLSWET